MPAFRKSGILLLSAFILAASSMQSALASTQSAVASLTPREVAEKYDEQMRISHTTLSTKIKLSTCKYKVDGTSMQCVDPPRVRVVENVVKYFGRDLRSLGILSEPV